MTSAVPAHSPEAFTSFGSLLRFLRVRARLSQRELSIAVGYSEAHISRLEQGARRPDYAAVRAHIVPALGLDEASPWAARLIALATSAPAAGPTPEIAAPAPAPSAGALAGLVATKLYRPQLRPGALARERLLRQLDGALTVPLTLISAPAGFGKSTLLAQWLTNLERRAQGAERPGSAGADPALRSAWLSLDASDNELIVFLRYLIAALRSVGPTIGADSLALLGAPETPPLRALLTPLINDLAALPHPLVLTLDDYHILSNPLVHDAVSFLLDHVPPQFHLLIASRADLPFSLSRLRVRGQVLELRGADLRFTASEAAAFLDETMGLGVSEAEAAMLETRTEGWAAGLQLAALAMREHADRQGFVASFAGSNRYVLDYLAEEVLDRLPGHLRNFLLQTSVLDRLCGELCDALFGIAPDAGEDAGAPARTARESYSQRILAELERLNLFLTPLDSQRRWYRYHPLFAEMLRVRLRAGTRAEQLRGLYRRANAWLWGHGLLAEALSCALAAPDHELAADQIEAVSRTLLGRGESVTLLEWIRALPEALISSRPGLCLAGAWALFHTNQWNAIEAYLTRAEQALDDPGRAGAADERSVRLEILALRGCLAGFREASPQGIAWCREALESLPADDLRLRSVLFQALGTAHYTLGHGREAQHAAREATVVATRGRYLFQAIHSFYYHMAGMVGLGWLTEATAYYERALRFAAEIGSPQTPALGMVMVMQGRVACERYDLAAAERYFAEALARCQQLGNPEALADAYLSRARLAQARGDAAGATDDLRQALNIVATSELHPVFVSEVIGARISQLVARGALAEAEALAREHSLGLDSPITFRRQPELLALARLTIARGQRAAGIALLEAMLATAWAGELHGIQIELLLALAMALRAAGERARAHEALGRALDLAAPEGFVLSFICEGPPMAELLREARAAGAHPAYCERLLAAFPSAAS